MTSLAVKKQVSKNIVSAIVSEVGFTHSSDSAIEQLSETFDKFVATLAKKMNRYCIAAGRTKPTSVDLTMALREMNISLSKLKKFARRPVNKSAPPLQLGKPIPPRNLNVLQAGVKPQHHSYIPPSLPPFPDPHSFVRTSTHKKPITEYEAIREKAARQAMEMEQSLNKYLVRTSETQSLFEEQDENDPFLLIKPIPPDEPIYLSALIPKDQIFDDEDEEEDDEDSSSKEQGSENLDGSGVEEKDGSSAGTPAKLDADPKTQSDKQIISNPFLMPARSPGSAMPPPDYIDDDFY